MRHTTRSDGREHAFSLTILLGVVAIATAITVARLAPARAQQPTPGATTSYMQPKTPWGEPDLQGIWGGRHQTVTPLERSKEFAGREFLTEEEIATRQKEENEMQAKKDALVQRGRGADLGLRENLPERAIRYRTLVQHVLGRHRSTRPKCFGARP